MCSDGARLAGKCWDENSIRQLKAIAIDMDFVLSDSEPRQHHPYFAAFSSLSSDEASWASNSSTCWIKELSLKVT